MKKDIIGFIENNVKQWRKNEQRKKARKKAYYQKPYPCDKDIYGKEEGEKT